MAYEKINWKNGIDGKTPINAENLNKMEEGIFNNDEAITTINDNLGEISLLLTEKKTIVGAVNEVNEELDKLNPTIEDTDGWIALNEYVKYRVKNDVLYFAGNCADGLALSTNTYTKIATLPHKPTFDIPFAVGFVGGDASHADGLVNAGGEVVIYSTTASKYWRFSGSFPL